MRDERYGDGGWGDRWWWMLKCGRLGELDDGDASRRDDDGCHSDRKDY